MKIIPAVFVLVLTGAAPFQCAADPEPARRIQDTPAEALWGLSERFRREGQDDARRVTLTELVERYPSSREAERAQRVLNGEEVEPDPAPITEGTAGGQAPAPAEPPATAEVEDAEAGAEPEAAPSEDG